MPCGIVKKRFKDCAADVSLLHQGFEKFRQEVKNLTFREDLEDSTNPFPGVRVGVKNCTTAGLANLIFRYVHLKPYTVGITRKQGYPEEAQLEMAREYLAYRNILTVDFELCRRRREKRRLPSKERLNCL